MERLGYKEGTNPNIRDHKFFERINWKNLEERKVTPPFKPSVVSDRTNFFQIIAGSSTLTLSSLEPPLRHSFSVSCGLKTRETRCVFVSPNPSPVTPSMQAKKCPAMLHVGRRYIGSVHMVNILVNVVIASK